MKDFLLWILNFLGMAYWVEIVTDYPRCTYYFGPFLSYKEAKKAHGGYVEDLQQENAQGIAVTIERTKPANLTVFDEQEEIQKFQRVITLGGTAS